MHQLCWRCLSNDSGDDHAGAVAVGTIYVLARVVGHVPLPEVFGTASVDYSVAEKDGNLEGEVNVQVTPREIPVVERRLQP